MVMFESFELFISLRMERRKEDSDLATVSLVDHAQIDLRLGEGEGEGKGLSSLSQILSASFTRQKTQ